MRVPNKPLHHPFTHQRQLLKGDEGADEGRPTVDAEVTLGGQAGRAEGGVRAAGGMRAELAGDRQHRCGYKKITGGQG